MSLVLMLKTIFIMPTSIDNNSKFLCLKFILPLHYFLSDILFIYLFIDNLHFYYACFFC